MTKFYIPIAICSVILFAYLVGTTHGHNKCMQQIATQTINASQQQTIKKEKINAEIYRTGVADIRNILRTKYTIAE